MASGATVIFYKEVQLSAQGTVTNTVDAIGNNGASGGNFEELTDSDTATVIVEGTPAIGITKTADVTSVNAANQVITYTYTVSNAGDVPLTGITLSDDNFTPGDTNDDFSPTLSTNGNGDAILDVGESWTYTATYTVAQADLDDGSDLVNVATADSNETAPETDDAIVDVVQNPNFTIVKEADVDSVSADGDVINYTYTITNTGNQSLTGVTLSDDNFTSGVPGDDFNPTLSTNGNGDAILDVGESWTYTASYTATQADIDSGEALVNVATADTDQTDPKTDTETVAVDQNPNFTIVKEANVDSVDADGDVITYTYTIANTGNQSLTGVTLSDDNFTSGVPGDDFNPTLSTNGNGDAILDVGESWTYTASYTATQADIDSGADLVNVATADTDQTDPKTDNATVDVVQTPNLSIVKDADVTEVDGAGDQIVYTYTVQNTGNVTLENVSVTDDNFTAATGDDFTITLDTTTLAPGETATGTYTYAVTQADIDSGADLVNVATADSDQTDPKTEDETVDVLQNPNFTIVKEADVASVDAANDVINYTYRITNTGNQSLTGVTLSDDNFTAGDTSDDFNPTLSTNGNGDTTLDVGEFWTYTASYTVDQDDIDSGADLVNVATADTDQTGPKTDDAVVDVLQEADFLLTKDADVTEVDAAGDVITYTYTLENTGTVSLTNITLSDDNFTPANTGDDFTPTQTSNGNGDTTLDVGETWTYTATYTVTQADIDSGAALVNVATGNSDETDPKTDNETVTVDQNPNFTIVKSADVTEVDAANDVINYTYTITNTGNQTLTGVTLSDDNFTAGVPGDDFTPTFDSTSDDGNGVLDVGEAWTYTASYTATQGDIDSGADLVNVATADTDQTGSKTDNATVDVVQTPNLSIVKDADVTEVDGAGDEIVYTYTVTNTGNQTLENLSVTDDNFTPSDTGDDFSITLDTTTLAPGETATGTYTYTVTQADIDSGADLVNVATADTDQTDPKTEDETVDVLQNPNFTIVKSADVTEVDAANDVINYTYTITNTGNQTLTGVTLSDDNFTAGVPGDDFTPTFDSTSDDGNGVLDVGEAWTYTASYTATQGDIDSGADLVNVATADTDQTGSKTDNATVDVVQTPNLSIVKDADVTEVDGAGDEIVYTYTVTNTGNQTLENLSVTDDNFTPSDTGDDFSITLDTTTLAPGETATGTYTYTVTQADIDSGADLVNVATADTDQTDPKTEDETVDVIQDPSLSILKEADTGLVNAAGQVITYTYTVINTGNQSLTNVTLSDDNFTNSDTTDDFNPTLSTNGNGDTTLDVGEFWTYTATHTVTQAEIDRGSALVNVATADSDQTDPQTDNENVGILQDPSLSILKEADVTEVDGAGDQIVYTYTVKNTGNITLENVTVSDDNFTPDDGDATNGDETADDFAITLDQTTLAPGDTATGTYTYTVTQADIDSGVDLVNVATADSNRTSPQTDDETVDVVQNPNLAVTKTADVTEVDAAGDVITYTYTVENTGNVTLENVTLSDDNFTPGDMTDDFTPTFDSTSDNGNGVLDVGETWTYTTSYTVTQADIDSGADLVNVATANSDQTDPKTEDEKVDVVQNPNLSIVKDADVSEVDAAGDIINYTYTVTNTGNQTLTGVTLTDDNFTPGNASDDFNPTFDSTSDDGNGILDVGESWTYSASYTVTQADIDSGANLVNVATADSDQTQPKTDDAVVDIIEDADFLLLKTADINEVDTAGQVITYTYTLENTGNQTLTNVALSDDNFTSGDTSDDFTPAFDSTSDNGNGVLDVGETWTYTASYTVTQADIDSGADLVNVATGDTNETDPRTDNETVTVNQNPNLSILKEADVTEVQNVGDVINYTYTLSNTGNVTLENVTLTDDNFTPGDTSDDFSPTFDASSDNSNGVLDVGETWTYNASYTVTQADFDSGLDLVNVATADSDQTDPKTDDETVDVIQNPSITLDKVTSDGVVTGDNIGVSAGTSITWTYTVTNDGNLNLSNISLTDDEQGTVTNIVDQGDGDAILAPNETWVYELSGTAITGSYDNIGTVTGDHSGGQGQVSATDDSSYTGIAAPGVRTPGFWKNWTEVWDGDASNDSRFAGRSGFPSGDLLLAPYSASPEAPEIIDPVSGQYAEGILVGDYNRNGMTDADESTIFYTLNEAKSILGANNKIQKDDKRYTLDRSLIASWLNYTAFNPAPTDDIDNGIAWIQEHTPDENNDLIGDGSLILGAADNAVPASSDFWNEPSPIVPNGGELIHTALDNYNNFGLS